MRHRHERQPCKARSTQLRRYLVSL
jgi:hypothetical protein